MLCYVHIWSFHFLNLAIYSLETGVPSVITDRQSSAILRIRSEVHIGSSVQEFEGVPQICNIGSNRGIQKHSPYTILYKFVIEVQDVEILNFIWLYEPSSFKNHENSKNE